MCFPVCAGGCPEFRGNQYSNPGIATVLHYLAPVFLLLFCLAAEKRKPQLTEVIVLFLVILGVFLLASHGSIYTLLIPKEAMFFGIASAVFLSVYNLQPKKLLGRFGLLEIIGWGMLTGGLILAAFAHLWDIPGIWDGQTVFMVLGIVVYGTVIPFSCYLRGVTYIGPVKASMYSSVEPLTAAVLSFCLLGQSFGVYDLLGMGFIMGGVTTLVILGKEI